MNPLGIQLREEFRRNEHVCRKLIPILQILAHKARFRIVCALARGDFCVNDLALIIGEERPSNLSQHLKILRLAGIVAVQREEQRRVYHLADPSVRELINHFRATFLQPETNPKLQ